MKNERKRILKMLAKGKISVDEAERLLAALGLGDDTPDDASSPQPIPAEVKRRPKYLRVEIQNGAKHKGKGEHVNIRVPLGLLRAGMKFQSLLPEQAREQVGKKLAEHGINLDVAGGAIEEVIASLEDLAIEVNDGDEHIRVYCE